MSATVACSDVLVVGGMFLARVGPAVLRVCLALLRPGHVVGV